MRVLSRDDLPPRVRAEVEVLLANSSTTNPKPTFELVMGRGLRVMINTHEPCNLGVIPLSQEEAGEIFKDERPHRKLTRRLFRGTVEKTWSI